MKNSALIITSLVSIVFILFVGFLLLVQTKNGLSISDFLMEKEVTLKDIQHANIKNSDLSLPNDRPDQSEGRNASGNSNYSLKTRFFYVIIGSFRNLDSAREKAAMLKKTINAEFIVLPPSAEGYFRLSYGRYSTYGEAEAVIPEIRRTMGNDAWIYSAEN